MAAKPHTLTVAAQLLRYVAQRPSRSLGLLLVLRVMRTAGHSYRDIAAFINDSSKQPQPVNHVLLYRWAKDLTPLSERHFMALARSALEGGRGKCLRMEVNP